METQEIEVRFLGIDKEDLVKRLMELGAIDFREKLIEEVIIYDDKQKWLLEKRFVRIRKKGNTTTLVGLDWSKVVYDDARRVIENIYHIPFTSMRWFTFNKFE